MVNNQRAGESAPAAINFKSDPILTELSTPWLDYLHLARKREYPAGVFILNAGDPINELYFVKSGEVLVRHLSGDDVETALFLARKNSFLGLIGFFVPSETRVAWRTLSDTVVYQFTRSCIYRDMPPLLLLNLLEHMGRIAKNMSTRLSLDRGRKNEARLANLITHLMQTCPTEQRDGMLRVTPGITQGMLSELLGIHPVNLNKLLARFREEGIIGKFTKSRLEVTDLDKLQGYL